MIIKQYCQYKGIMCSLATEFGYCKVTACINREEGRMTNQEAISELIKYRRRLEKNYTIDAEPFDMAIEALQAQATLDDVSNAYENGYKQGKFEALQWIPCSERLPEGDVLCCDIHKNLMIGYVFVSESSNTGYNAESEQEYMYDVIAWMPLPEPMRLENES